LLISSNEAAGWRLPSGARCKKDDLNASAALRASRAVGIYGKIFKRGLRLANQDPPMAVFPLLVQGDISLASLQGDVVARWFSLGEAGALADDRLRLALDALARRVLAAQGARRGSALGVAGRNARSGRQPERVT
jgi:hypothetical protein